MGLIAFLTYPVFLHVERWNFFYSLAFLSEFGVPWFYVIVPILSATFGLFGFCWMTCLGPIMGKFLLVCRPERRGVD